MSNQGGRRPGAGRPKGKPNKKTQNQIDAVKVSGITPLDYMLQVMRDEMQETGVRVDAANKAAPYVHPKLASVEIYDEREPIRQVTEIRRVIVDNGGR